MLTCIDNTWAWALLTIGKEYPIVRVEEHEGFAPIYHVLNDQGEVRGYSANRFEVLMHPWQRRIYEQRCPDALRWFTWHQEVKSDYTYHTNRCSGLVVCGVCGHDYYEHPRHPTQDCLTVVCTGAVYKL